MRKVVNTPVLQYALQRKRPFSYRNAVDALPKVNKGTISGVLSRLTAGGLLRLDHDERPGRYVATARWRNSSNPIGTAQLTMRRAFPDKRYPAAAKSVEPASATLATDLHASLDTLVSDATKWRRFKAEIAPAFQKLFAILE